MRFLVFILLPLFAAPAFAFDTPAKQAIVLDYDTGAALYDKNAETQMYPASMTKMLTVYILFQELKAGKVKLDDTFFISNNAWQMGKGDTREGSNMFVVLNSQVKVEDLLRGIIVQSGNDACIAVAEGLAGTSAQFADRMNKVAGEIGMTGTHFTNPDGWPDPQHYTTAHDLATLAWHIIHDFPEYYHYFSEPSMTYNGIRQDNRNVLLTSMRGVAKGDAMQTIYTVDGLKTGHTEASGFGITISGVNKDGHRLIVVANGMASKKERAEQGAALLTYGFTNFETTKLFAAGKPVGALPVWFGASLTVPAVAANDIMVTLPRGAGKDADYVIRYESPVPAPVKKGDHVADLVVTPKNMPPETIPLIAGEDVAKAGFGEHIWQNIHALVEKH